MIAAILPLIGDFVASHWRAALIFAFACAFGGACYVIRIEQAHVLAAQQAAAAAKLQAATTAADAAKNQAALEQEGASAKARAIATANLRSKVHAQPTTSSCAGSAPVRALLDGLRTANGADHASAGAR